MDIADYKPDSICRALGLAGFYSSWTHGLPTQELRVLLCPSFHPELCIVFSQSEDHTNLTLACADTQIWHLDKPSPVKTHKDTATIKPPILSDLETDFRRALAQSDRLSVTLDGMSVDVFWRSNNTRLVVEGANPSRDDALGQFISDTIKVAFDLTSTAPCRDRLAHAGSYLGLALPLSEPVATKPTTRLAVLGVPDERAEMLGAIKATRDRKT